MDNSNNILVICDLSYVLYFIVYGSVSFFQKKYPQEAAYWIKPAEEVDQKNLPNLLNCENFKKVLKRYVMKRLETIDQLTKANYQDEIDSADRIDIVFAIDDTLTKNFRKDLYVEYKATRTISPKSYNIYAIKKYITDVIFKELELEKNYDYHMLMVEGAEADDVIACVCKNLAKDYKRTILYASDKDFLQLEGIDQYNLFGQKVEPKLGDKLITPKEYLKCKILLGDGSDNIAKVFSGVGPKKALKLVNDPEALKKKLLEDQNARKQFALNKKLISFDEIPKELEKHIVEKASQLLYENEVINKHVDFKDFMSL